MPWFYFVSCFVSPLFFEKDWVGWDCTIAPVTAKYRAGSRIAVCYLLILVWFIKGVTGASVG